jgi:hypothetical protein
VGIAATGGPIRVGKSGVDRPIPNHVPGNALIRLIAGPAAFPPSVPVEDRSPRRSVSRFVQPAPGQRVSPVAHSPLLPPSSPSIASPPSPPSPPWTLVSSTSTLLPLPPSALRHCSGEGKPFAPLYRHVVWREELRRGCMRGQPRSEIRSSEDSPPLPESLPSDRVSSFERVR